MASMYPIRWDMISYNVYYRRMLYGIHKIAFRAAKDDHRKEQGNQHKHGAVYKSFPIQGTTAHAAVLKGFEDRGEGIHGNDMLVLFRSGTQRVNHWSGIHEELQTEGD